MPSLPELAGLLIGILLIWFVFRMLKLAIRLFLFLATAAVVVGIIWWFFVR